MIFPRVIKTRRGRLDFGEVDTVIRRFIRYLRPHRRTMVLATLATMGTVVAKLAAPWPIKLIFDVALSDAMAKTWLGQWFERNAGTPTAALVVICAMVILIAVADAVFVFMRDVMLARTGQEVVGKLRHDLFRHLQRLSPDVFETRRTGDLLMRLTGDVQMLRQMLVNSWIRAGENFVSIVSVVAVMFWLNWKLALIATAMLPLLVFVGRRIGKQIKHAVKGQRERESEVASIAHEVIGAMTIVQAFNRQKVELQRFARQNRGSIRAGLKATRLESRLYRTVSLSSAVGLCAVLFVGVQSVLAGTMTPGDLLVFVAYLRALHKPLRKLTRLANTMAKATACGIRIAELFEIPPSVVDRPDAATAENVRGKIELRNVSFSYPTGAEALTNVSCVIEPGQRVAIVGHSGSGKSTIAKLLLRFYDPSEGAILLDDVDIRDFTLESLRRQVAVAYQDSVLFGLTMAQNIGFADADVDKQSVRRAARIVGADEFIDRLPCRFDERIGTRGETLSGGQRQRIALARALYRPSAVLLLDEPTTGLDAGSAALVERSWMNGDRSRTLLVICHDLAGMERFDRIVVLERGCVVDCGDHRALLDRCTVYTELFHNWQSRHKRDDATSFAEQVRDHAHPA